ncbi:MAG: phosphatidylglycerophosphatase [Gammaproteobacteria bacterium]|nr:phosphatidylglycerophosphatase [Gammaproteobacteria bacterium]
MLPLSPSFSRFLHITRSGAFFVFILSFCVFSYYFLDKPIAYYAKDSLNAQLINIAEFITHFGKGTVYYIALACAFLFFKFMFKSKAWASVSGFLFLAISIPGLLCTFLKMVLGRARPVLLHSEQLYGFTFFQTAAPYLSFPSGHSVLITSLMLGLCFVFTRYWITFLSLALLISATRVLIGAHYLSDVIAGMYLAILIVPLVHNYACLWSMFKEMNQHLFSQHPIKKRGTK